MTLRTITLLFLFCSLVVEGQVSIGHRGGVSFSRWVWTGADASKMNDSQTYVLGASAEIPVEVTMFGHGRLNTGFSFVQKGYELKSAGHYQIRCNYIQVPLTIGWAFDVRRFQFTPSIGGAFGWNVRGVDRSRFVDSNGKEFDLRVAPVGRLSDEGYYMRMPDQEWSVLSRLGIAYQCDHSALTLDISYQHGLSNAMFDVDFVDANGNPVAPYEATQRTFAIQLGYRMALGRGRMAPMPVVLPTDSLGNVSPVPSSGPRVMVGTRFGITSSTMDFTASDPTTQERVTDGAAPIVGMSAAAVVRIRLSRHVSLQTELAYTQKGWKSRWFSRPTLENDVIRMNYVELPVLANYHVGAGAFRPYVLAGPVLGRGLGGVQVYHAIGAFAFYEASSITFGGDHAEGNDRRFAALDFSATAGAGLSYKLGHSELNIDVRYHYSFTDFYVEPDHTFSETKVEAYHRSWMMNIGYLVPWRR